MKYFVDKNESIRLDIYLTTETGYTRSYIKTLVDGGFILLNNQRIKSGKIIKTGDVIDVNPPEPVIAAEPKDIPVDIVYEDDDIAVINKPQGLVVHPAPGNWDNTLVNGLLFHLKNLSCINGALRPGIVHRLDKNTSGLMVVAKNDEAHLSLSSQIALRSVTKIYYGLCRGHFSEEKGTIKTLIGRSPKDRKLMAVLTKDGREAITMYEVEERFDSYDLVKFRILTGRTHQIRVHCKYMNHPIVGDEEYGQGQEMGSKGQLLHSAFLSFEHPRTKEIMEFSAPLPKYFEDILSKIRR